MATQLQTPEAPDWEAQLRARGIAVHRAKPGYVFEPVLDRPRERKRIARFWHHALRRMLGRRALL